MSTGVATETPPTGALFDDPTRSGPKRRISTRLLGLIGVLAALVVVCLLSIAVGSRAIPLGDVWHALFSPSGTDTDTVVRELRIPRTVLGLLAGAALGLAGCIMQVLTRNPLSDPGLFGINQGAAAAIVIGITLFGVTGPAALVWFAFAGAVVATVLVYGVSTGNSGASAARFVLAGIAVQYVLVGLNQALQLADRAALDRYRFWIIGSLANRDPEQLYVLGPVIGAGMLLALALAPGFNAMALGDDTARALGAHVGRTKILGLLAVILLCGAATAACGPIAFIGLMIPQIVRTLVGVDHRWVLPMSMLAAPVLLIGGDVVGRVINRPQEVQVGIITDVVGGLVFIFLIRRRRTAQL
ncbi:iron ABC transporter permease [Virgisporangium aliadipatigenens]|uniref:Iron ABC transporter permease n=1 Tax=Virgisporangium aliadipatigenens TaxID=741659 RepID=A0A8J3YGX1_9ACTN|nr:iron ABC transporter permease [Virgisporangium aliadipatigenens]GIJ44989.1 iron ABC transporter permease [Virgisporangium aliadipatigenens]